MSAQRYVCARCGNPVGYWFHGWKHHRGGGSKLPSCGQKPIPAHATPKSGQ